VRRGKKKEERRIDPAFLPFLLQKPVKSTEKEKGKKGLGEKEREKKKREGRKDPHLSLFRPL